MLQRTSGLNLLTTVVARAGTALIWLKRGSFEGHLFALTQES